MIGQSNNPQNLPITDGRGYFKYSEGVSYEGDWRNGKRHGYGYLKN